MTDDLDKDELLAGAPGHRARQAGGGTGKLKRVLAKRRHRARRSPWGTPVRATRNARARQDLFQKYLDQQLTRSADLQLSMVHFESGQTMSENAVEAPPQSAPAHPPALFYGCCSRGKTATAGKQILDGLTSRSPRTISTSGAPKSCCSRRKRRRSPNPLQATATGIRFALRRRTRTGPNIDRPG